MYHVFVQPLQKSVLDYIRKRRMLKAGDRVGVAVSGGADSVALFRLLLDLRGELGIVPSVIHFNHKLRGQDSDDDERFVADLSTSHGVDFHCSSANVKDHAASKQISLETAAREKRYEFFQRLLNDGTAEVVATAHTLDDQAETVLLKLARGAGSRGLAGVYPTLVPPAGLLSGNSTSACAAKAIIRPLLGTRRRHLEEYLRELQQPWREDKSNRDLRHARNRVRHGILPRMERNLNPAIREALAETAELARAEEEYWQTLIAEILPQVWQSASNGLKIAPIVAYPVALQRRLIRAAAESRGLTLDFHHVEEVRELLSVDREGKSAELPAGWSVHSRQGELQFACQEDAHLKSDYEYCLPIPGDVTVPEIGSRFEALVVQTARDGVYNPGHLLNRDLLPRELVLRNWRPGDVFWPAQRKSPKKIKELLQAQHVTGAERRLWPVVVSGTEIIWVRGFPVPGRLRPGDSDSAVLIQELPMKI